MPIFLLGSTDYTGPIQPWFSDPMYSILGEKEGKGETEGETESGRAQSEKFVLRLEHTCTTCTQFKETRGEAESEIA